MYDWYLGGAQNFAVDPELGRRVLERFPHAARNAQANRDFLRRAVGWCASTGDEPAARTDLLTALTLAAPERRLQVFLDEGEPMATLLALGPGRRGAVLRGALPRRADDGSAFEPGVLEREAQLP